MQSVDPASAVSSHHAAAPGVSIYGRITRRLLPLLFICYVACYLDRVNIGFAKLQMASDLSFSDTVYGLGAGTFFIGYLAFETPSNMILYRVGARRWLDRIMVTWGVISAAMLFVRTPGAFYATRFLLGVAEAGFFPGVVLYLTQWFPSRRRAGVVAIFMTGIPVSGVLGGPLSGWIMSSMGGTGGLASWQWLLLIEAMPSVVLAGVLWKALPDRVADVDWLSPAEKGWVQSQLDAEHDAKPDASLRQMFTDARVWLCVLINFCIATGQYGVSFWLPTLIKRLGLHDNFQIGYLSAIPYLAGVIAMLMLSRTGDRLRERRWHVAAPALVGAAGFVLSTFLQHDTTLALAALTIATGGVMATLPLFWCLPTSFLKGASGAAGIGLINSVGALAGFVSPLLTGVLNDFTHDARYGVAMLAAWLVLGAALVLRLPRALVNR